MREGKKMKKVRGGSICRVVGIFVRWDWTRWLRSEICVTIRRNLYWTQSHKRRICRAGVTWIDKILKAVGLSTGSRKSFRSGFGFESYFKSTV